MKIALIGPVYPYRGGIAHHSTSLAGAMQEAGHVVRIFSFQQQYPAWLYPGKSDRDPSRLRFEAPAEFILRPLSSVTWQQTARQIIKFQPDLVIFQWWTTFWTLAYTALAGTLRRAGIKTVFLIHNVLPHEPQPLDGWLARLALRQAGAYLVHSQGEKQRLQGLLPAATSVYYAPHPAYRLFGGRDISRPEAKARLGLNENAYLLLFFGLVRPYKGLHRLLEAMGNLKKNGACPNLLVAGEFWEKPSRYREQVQRLGLDDLVRFDNRYIPNEEVSLLFSAADLYVAPYLAATQSGSAHLAMGFGLPILASDRAIDPQEGSYLPLQTFTAGDAEALAQAIMAGQLAAQQFKYLPPAGDGWQDLVEALVEA